VRRLAWQYLVIRMAAAPTDMLLFGLSGWFQGRGDTRTPMKANVLANLSNIVLYAVLVCGFGPIPVGRRLLVVAASFQIFDAVTTVLYQALSGAGDTRFAMRVSVFASWLVKLPVAWVMALPLGLGAVGAWMGFDAELALLAAVFAWRVRSGRWLVLAEPDPEPVPTRV